MSIRLSDDNGFTVHSHAGDDWRVCREHVAERLGMPTDFWRAHHAEGTPRPALVFMAREPGAEPDHVARVSRARAIWDQADDAYGTVVERYLAGRGLDLPRGANVLRYHPRCPWGDKASGQTLFVPAMVAAMRSIVDDRITAVHRTRLTDQGEKVDRMMFGPARGSAVKVDDNDEVTIGLAIGEGIETVLAARQFGFRPAWALTSAGAIAILPVLPGIEALTLLGERDPASARAVEACASRWHGAGREVIVIEPMTGSDLNDALMSRRAA